MNVTQTAIHHADTTDHAPKRREALNETRIWHVYARRQYDEPLHEIGNVMADDEELAKVYARSIYDEFSWIEMIIVPRDCIITIIAS